LSAEALAAWDALTAHLRQWFFEPDIQALETVLTACSAHYHVEADPIWLLVIGPSRSGKTSVLVRCAEALPNAFTLSSVSSKTFISGFRARNAGLLDRMGASVLFLFKDFTSILSLREEDRAVVYADLREIYDGSIIKSKGTGEDKAWFGKCTIIAASTPAIDRAWGMQRDLGERFACIRLHREEDASERIAACARRQRGHEREIKSRMLDLTSRFFVLPRSQSLPTLPPVFAEQVDALSAAVAQLRGKVHREGGRLVTEAPHIEEPAGIAKVLDALLRYHARLFFRSTPDERDLAIARRVALDSISPQTRRRFLLYLLDNPNAQAGELAEACLVSRSAIDRISEDLELLGVVEVKQNAIGANEYVPQPQFLERCRRAKLLRQ